MDYNRTKSYLSAFLAVIAGIALDQYTKLSAVRFLKDAEPFILIKNVFQLRYLENRGAAFGILQNRKIFFILSFLIIMTCVIYLYGRLPAAKRFLPLRACGALIMAGASGNMIDRLRLGYVVDFFYFELIDFPIFNVADIFVVVGVILLAVLILFVYNDHELDMILSLKKRDENS